MQKIRDFIWFFCWMLSVEIVLRDLNISFTNSYSPWAKYFVPFVAGLVNAFYLGPLQRKRQKVKLHKLE